MSSSKEGGEGIRIRWTLEEDVLLMKAVSKYGEGYWDTIQKNSGLDRSSLGCKMRWYCHIKPGLIKGKFTQEEEDKMMHQKRYKKIVIRRNKWIEIAKEIPGLSAFDVETSRTQQLVDESQAAHNPAVTTGNTSMFGQGSGPFHQFPDSDMDGNSSSMFAQGSVSSQFPDLNSKYEQGLGSYQFPDPESTFAHGSQGSMSSQFGNPDSMFAKGSVSSRFLNTDSMFAQGSMSSQFPSVFTNPDTTGKTRRFAQGSAASQFPTVSPSPVMQQYNSLNSTFISTPATGPASIDQYTSLSGNTSMDAGLPSLTGGAETQQGSSSSSSTLKKSFRSLDKPRSPRDNGYFELIIYPAKVSEGSSDDSFLQLNIELANQLDLSISVGDLDRAMNPLNETLEASNKK